MSQSLEPAEFIDKLLKMIQQNSSIISWNDTETQVVIKDVKKMSEQVIPFFFRHTKYQSFVRQLNMYNFHKVCRQKNNTINFKNDLFYKGNQSNFHKIKRKKKMQGKFDTEISQEQIKHIKSHPTIPSHFKELIIKLITYKIDVINHNLKIKSFFMDANNDLKTPKFRKFDKDIQQIKSIIDNMNQRSDNIDQLFNVSSKKVQNSTDNQIKYNDQFQNYQEKLDQNIENPMIKARILGIHDQGSQLSLDRFNQNNNFPRFTTKVSFINIVDVPQRDNWRQDQLDRLSACSIQDDLEQ